MSHAPKRGRFGNNDRHPEPQAGRANMLAAALSAKTHPASASVFSPLNAMENMNHAPIAAQCMLFPVSFFISSGVKRSGPSSSKLGKGKPSELIPKRGQENPWMSQWYSASRT